MQIVHSIQQFVRDEEGVTAIEYGLIAVMIIGGVKVIGTQLCGTFNTIATELGGSPVACA